MKKKLQNGRKKFLRGNKKGAEMGQRPLTPQASEFTFYLTREKDLADCENFVKSIAS